MTSKYINISKEIYSYKSIVIKPNEIFTPKDEEQQKDMIEFITGKGKGKIIVHEGGDITITGNDFYADKISKLEKEKSILLSEKEVDLKNIKRLTDENMNLQKEVARLNLANTSRQISSNETKDIEPIDLTCFSLEALKDMAKAKGIDVKGNLSTETLIAKIKEAK